MYRLFLIALAAIFAGCASSNQPADDGWISLFDGETLDGWRAGQNAETFSVQDGAIVANGDVSHLFYVGPVENHDFTNFEFAAEVMTHPGSNSGIYFHTEFQEEGWPAKGYEAQVNNTQSDTRRTGSLYAIQDYLEAPAQDNEWFPYYIRVNGDSITIRVNGITTVEYEEPEGVEREESMAGRVLSSGTFALQGHDPGSTVMYRNIRVRPLP